MLTLHLLPVYSRRSSVGRISGAIPPAVYEGNTLQHWNLKSASVSKLANAVRLHNLPDEYFSRFGSGITLPWQVTHERQVRRVESKAKIP